MDGAQVHALIERCPPLDTNSVYCNLLQCQDFAETSIVAQNEQGEIVGFISGYVPPKRQRTLFIWQVALDSEYRGQGIASEMLARLFSRDNDLKYIETTISPSNTASQKLFKNFFTTHHMALETHTLFESGIHFSDDHEDEVLYRAGPAKQFAPIHAV
ncbi:putative L-2,4-diaminobutyrate acetyltransferase [Oceanospirillum sp. MED92]|uniref:L-2,4-diaminobutyric acid acetyltransferase n=2 Tax=Neptuniibacter caesariensis TaxID=207954 RepID=A0A7U8C5C8_NEPCE|nr:putative L-2,4-diaminobutyrate acetyltransferase [Oceanospirillum sp. MED92] [Neptuniibacter caesariensis]